MAEVAEVLDRTLVILDSPEKWTQGKFYMDKQDGTRCYCLDGALMQATADVCEITVEWDKDAKIRPIDFLIRIADPSDLYWLTRRVVLDAMGESWSLSNYNDTHPYSDVIQRVQEARAAV